MKSRSLIGCGAAFFLALGGCGIEATEPAPSGTNLGPSTTQSSSVSSLDEGGLGSASTTDPAPGTPGSTDPTAFGKRCNASCSVVNVGTGMCPATIGGYGSTSFLGGCNKACAKAQGDAASKLPSHCKIDTCSFSGC